MFVDIHAHILHELDDGAADLETSLGMLEIASNENKNGCIIATPHYICGSMYNGAENAAERLDELKVAADGAGIGIDLQRGNEIFLSTEIPELLENGEISTLAGSSYVLVEFPMMGIPGYAYDILYRLRLNGYRPIVAHPERCRDIGNNPNLLIELIEQGIYFQINAGSLRGSNGKQIRESALTLLRHNMVHFVASDAHSCRSRSPKLLDAYKIVCSEMGQNIADRLFTRNGEAVLQNCELEADEVIEVKKGFGYSLSNAMKRMFSAAK